MGSQSVLIRPPQQPPIDVSIVVEAVVNQASFPPLTVSRFPTKSNTGVLPGVARTTVASLTVVAGGTYENLTVQAQVVPPIGSTPIVFRNCWFQGPVAAPTGFSGLVRTHINGHCPLEFYDCTFQPQVPHWYWIGLQGYRFTAVRCQFRYLVDGIEVFNTTTPNDPSGVVIQDCWIGDHSWWDSPPDTSHTDGSHPDCIQIQGNTGTVIRGNTLINMIDDTWGPADWGTQHGVAALLIKPDVSLITGLDISRNFIDGGAFSVNIANDDPRFLGNIGSISDNRFGRNQRIQGSGGDTTYTISMPANVLGTFTGNVYDDTGAAILVRHNG